MECPSRSNNAKQKADTRGRSDLLLQKALQVHSHSPPTPTSEPNVIEEEDRSEIRQGCREPLQRLSSLRQKKGGDDDRCHWTTDNVRQV